MSTTNLVINIYVCLILFLIFNTARSEANVALVMTAEQSSDINVDWIARKVVDGCTQTTLEFNCCAHTKRDQTQAWWRVDMGELMAINRITIYYRGGFQQRFAGYQLYLSNTTDSPTQGVLCYEDKSSTKAQVELLVTHQCPYVARFVTVYNYRNNPKRYTWYDDFAVLELCEVQVFGCQVGQYGDGDCNSSCSGNCYGGNCNSTTGSCFYSFPGKYGDYCNNDCSTDCKDSICEKDTGYCAECVPGLFGSDCTQTCPVSCKDECGRNAGDCNGKEEGLGVENIRGSRMIAGETSAAYEKIHVHDFLSDYQLTIHLETSPTTVTGVARPPVQHTCVTSLHGTRQYHAHRQFITTTALGIVVE
ncbi:uncharacterized protein LOC110451258 [Mizuhopecten yessoensis]|uniref:uncharacterized protein LOC110451258 n=1 Tax=Mizuhopecten yessoensis TaxID=6573 RepID=UPI000B458FD6|nr:uncharacterized protein LOC110451258 [Mizuhopecten yessoensis]